MTYRFKFTKENVGKMIYGCLFNNAQFEIDGHQIQLIQSAGVPWAEWTFKVDGKRVKSKQHPSFTLAAKIAYRIQHYTNRHKDTRFTYKELDCKRLAVTMVSSEVRWLKEDLLSLA